jgi:hypothetical protein
MDVATRRKFTRRMNQIQKLKSQLTRFKPKPVLFTEIQPVIIKKLTNEARLNPASVQQITNILRIDKVEGKWRFCQNRAWRMNFVRFLRLCDGNYG